MASKKELFSNFNSSNRRLAHRVHDLLLEHFPQLEPRRAWGGVGYKWERNYSCLIAPYDDHIKLMIWRGIELPDPSHLLQGSGKNTRHVRIECPEDIRVRPIVALLKAQHRLYRLGAKDEQSRRARRARPVPAEVRQELEARGLLEAYRSRPPYQRRDYIEWILAAKRPATRERRLEQMLSELEGGDLYMKMPWSGGRG